MIEPKYDCVIECFLNKNIISFALEPSEPLDKFMVSLHLSEIERIKYDIFIQRYSLRERYYMDEDALSHSYWIGFNLCFDAMEIAKHMAEGLETFFQFNIIILDMREGSIVKKDNQEEEEEAILIEEIL